MTRLTIGTLALWLVAAGADDAATQSLGDVARKEAERRGTVAAPGKTYTNDSLTPDFTKPAAPAGEAKPEANASGTDVANGKLAKPNAEVATEDGAQAPVDVANDPVEAAKWGVTPRDQQTAAQSDDQNEEYWRTTASLLKARLAEVDGRLLQLRDTLAATPKGAPGSEREIVERAFQKAQASQQHANEDWIKFETRARQRNIPMNWIR